MRDSRPRERLRTKANQRALRELKVRHLDEYKLLVNKHREVLGLGPLVEYEMGNSE
jgi:hypothetical protein